MIFELIVIFILLFIIIGLVYQFLYGIYMEVLIVSLLFYISYLTLKIRAYVQQKKQENRQIISEKSLQSLKKYITENLKKGFKRNLIKQELVKQGWPKEKVEEYLKEKK